MICRGCAAQLTQTILHWHLGNDNIYIQLGVEIDFEVFLP